MKSLWIPLAISIFTISLLFILFNGLEGYFEEALESSRSNLIIYSLLSFVILLSDILLPVPSSVVLYLNGWVLGFLQGFLLSYIAAVLSSFLGYLLGRTTSFVRPSSFAKAILWIETYGFLAVLVSRGIPILSESISYTAGFNKMKWTTLLLSSAVGYLPVCLLFSYFGSIGQNEDAFLWSFLASIILASALWFFGKSILRKRVDA